MDGEPKRASADPADVRLKRKGSVSRRVSPESTNMEFPQTGIPHKVGSFSRYRSPSAASIGTDISHHSRAQSPPSISSSADVLGTPPRKRPTLENSHIQDSRTNSANSGPYTTFSSNFTGLTSESAELSQGAVNKTAKRRGRKPSGNNVAERRQSFGKTSVTSSPDRRILTNQSKQDNIAAYDGTLHQTAPIDHTPRVIFQIPDSPQPLARSPLTNQLANVSPHLHRTLPPRPSITPPPGSSPQLLQKYRPPAVVFAIDNRAESRLLTDDVQSFIEQFTRNTRVIAPPSKPAAPNGVYPIGVIMWQSMPVFYKWYSETMGQVEMEIGPLRFELMDVHWQSEKVFIVPEGNLNYFRTLKQYVWVLFWVASNLNHGPSLFRISVSPVPSRSESLAAAPSAWHPVNSKDQTPQISGASLENIMVVAEPRVPQISTSPPQSAPPRPPILLNLTSRTSNIEHMLNAKEGKEVKVHAGRRSIVTAGDPKVDQSSKSNQQNASTNSNRPPHPSQYIHGPPGPPVNINRTSWDKIMLRDRAHAFVSYSHVLRELYNNTDISKARWKE